MHPAELVKAEYLQLRLQHEIAKEVEDKITKTRRTAMLHEQLNVIKKELGLSKGAYVSKHTGDGGVGRAEGGDAGSWCSRG